ncbi:MAG TPA: 50S ribosomal protein L25 [Phycisphaerales bacterium]|nr:50S ribosomal protein L25 [Phycisphaerales bacterium]
MQGNTPILSAKRRERVGTRYSNRIRQAGGLPAVIYGHGEAPVAIALDARDTLGHFTKGEKVYKIQMEGDGQAQVVLLKDLQYDHLGTTVVHADFARVDLDERVEVKVPVHFVGEAVGLKTAGAILMHPTNEVEIECSVASIPESIEVDISGLGAGQILHASDLSLPMSSMKLVTEPEAIIAQIVIQTETQVAEAAPVEAGAASQPEVITERKKEEGKE